MIRSLAAGLVLSTIFAVTDAAACMLIGHGSFEVAAKPSHGTAPPPARVAVVRTSRGLCHDIGTLELRLHGMRADAYGYRLAIAESAAPPGLRFGTKPYASVDNTVAVTWLDSDAALRRGFYFTLAVTVVDRAGRRSHPVFVRVNAGPHQRRPPQPLDRPVPPVVRLAGFAGLFGLSSMIGRLRRPQLKPD